MILKLESLFSQNIYIISSYFKFVDRFRLKRKKFTSSLKNMLIIKIYFLYVFFLINGFKLLSQNCCSYIFRCGKTPSQIRNYEHISDQLSDDDENLLNM